MCGRAGFSIPRGELLENYPWLRDAPELEPRYNIAPTDPVLTVGPAEARSVRWGIEGSRGGLFTLRAETAARQPFLRLLESRRVVVPFSHFYEWRHEAGRRAPFALRRADGAPLSMAGLLGRWESGPAVTIITTAASADLDGLHDRMPVILSADDAATWVLEELSADQAAAMLRPAPPGTLVAAPASPLVNSVRNDGPELLDPAALPRVHKLDLMS